MTTDQRLTLTLPDSSKRQFDGPVSVAELAAAIGPVIEEGFYYDIAFGDWRRAATG